MTDPSSSALAPASTTAGSATTAAALGREPPARFRDVVVAEWIKMRSLRSTWWSLALSAGFVLATVANAARVDYVFYAARPPDPQMPRMYALSDAFPQVCYLTLMLVAGSVGALALAGEYGSGSIRTTISAVPARAEVVLAKAAVLAGIWTSAGAVISGGSFWLSQAILAGHHAGVSISDPGSLRAVAASALLPPIAALVGLAFGAIVRHSGGAMVGAAFTLLILPTIFSRSTRWSADLMFSTVAAAWDRLSRAWAPEASAHFFVATVRGSWIVYAVWPVAMTLLAVLVVRRRDV